MKMTRSLPCSLPTSVRIAVIQVPIRKFVRR